MNSVKFEDGIIGKWQSFLTRRYGTGPMLGKAVGSVLVSTALDQVVIKDKHGDMKPNIYVLNIARTGLGSKTPVVNRMRPVIKEFNSMALGPSKITPESLPRFLKGKMIGDDEQSESKIEPRTHFTILNDEVSRLLGDIKMKTYMAGTEELLSKGWDGYIESYYTNKRGFEGDVDVYISMYGAGSYYFLKLLDDAFFIQGLGNRVLWIDEPVTPPKFDDGYFLTEEGDTEYEQLKDWTVKSLKQIRENALDVNPYSPKMWVDWANGTISQIIKSQSSSFLGESDFEAEYASKMIMNSLKLATIYAASCFSIQTSNQQITVAPEHLKLAIEDSKEYIRMWVSLMRKTQVVKEKDGAREFTISTRKIDIIKVLEVGVRLGRFTERKALAELDATDKRGMSETIGLCMDKGLVEEVTGVDATGSATRGKLTDEEYDRFKPPRGYYPHVFEVTESGKKYLKAPAQVNG